MLCIKRARAHWHLSWIYAHLVNNGHKEINMVSNSLKKYEKYHERKKNGDSMFCNGVTRENARACSYARFCIKCLHMTWNVCKINLRRFWAFKNFAHSTDARTYAHARVFWPEINRTDIDLNHDKYEWKIPFGYEDMIMRWFSKNFTKWRLDDVISQGQGWKTYRVLCPYAYTYVCQISKHLIEPFQSYHR